MTATTPTIVTAADRSSATPAWLLLARMEMIRYALRPAFVLGAGLTLAALLPYLDAGEPVDELSMIAPAALIGLIGITAERPKGLGIGPLRRRRRFDAGADGDPHARAPRCVPRTLHGRAASSSRSPTRADLTDPPPESGYAALMSDGWVLAVWFGLGAVSCLGGPILGVLIARMTDRRAAPILTTVGLVALAIVFQGLFEPLRRIRVFMPWTYWGGPFGIDGDPQRSIVLTGSPYWWVLYLLTLCAVAALMTLRQDRTWRSQRNRTAFTALLVTAVITCLLAMWTGTPDTIINPLTGDGTSWGGRASPSRCARSPTTAERRHRGDCWRRLL